jgi:hypothetical protein
VYLSFMSIRIADRCCKEQRQSRVTKQVSFGKHSETGLMRIGILVVIGLFHFARQQ